MNTFARVIFTCLCCALVSCAKLNLPLQMYASDATCQAACEQRLEPCGKTCRNNCQQCLAYARQTAFKHYIAYENEEYVQGRMIARDLKSYRDPLQCLKTTCNCRADYQVCMQSCGGIIRKELRPDPVCQ